MHKRLAVALFAALAAFAVDARAVSIDWTTVGDPNNPADSNGHGSVPTAYRIDRYEVTNRQYVDFLNAVDPSGANTLGLFNTMMNNASYIAISYNSGASSGQKYSVASGRDNQPVTYVTTYSALRFANWLNNGQGNSSTEIGAYTLLGGTPTPSNSNSISRNPQASVFVPNNDEWYKAAYYSPLLHNYFSYPTSSNVAPNASGPTLVPNSANYNGVVPNTFVDIGSYPNSPSPFGTFDQGGNAFELNQSTLSGGLFMYGGYNGGSASSMSSASPFPFPITADTWDSAIGFRVAAVVPEPSAIVLAALGILGVLVYARRRPWRARGV
jgi:hypothetical protein